MIVILSAPIILVAVDLIDSGYCLKFRILVMITEAFVSRVFCAAMALLCASGEKVDLAHKAISSITSASAC